MAANLEGLARAPKEDAAGEERRALVIAAHPDDADFAAAGTAYLSSRQGRAFYYPGRTPPRAPPPSPPSTRRRATASASRSRWPPVYDRTRWARSTSGAPRRR